MNQENPVSANPVLLLIDIQNDYFDDGALPVVGSLTATTRAGDLLVHFRARRWPVVHVRHESLRPGATYLRPGTPGAEIHPSVAPVAGETVVLKHYPNSFRGTTLLDTLRNLDAQQLVIAGMMTHMCIDTTTRAAADLGYDCVLAHDACATRALQFGETEVPASQVHAAYLAALNGMFAQVKSTAKIVVG
jgi:nicotinamidase-related amidase